MDQASLAGLCIQSWAPLIWSRVPETTLPQVTLGELTFPCIVVKFKQPFI